MSIRESINHELTLCLTWAEYAANYGSFEAFDRDVSPMNALYFSVSEIELIYKLCNGHNCSPSIYWGTKNGACSARITNVMGEGKTELLALANLLSKLQ